MIYIEKWKNMVLMYQKLKSRKYCKIGGLVRINKINGVFDKDYLPNYTTEVFQIATVKNTTAITHKLSDKSNQLILGDFYEKELSKVIQ